MTGSVAVPGMAPAGGDDLPIAGRRSRWPASQELSVASLSKQAGVHSCFGIHQFKGVIVGKLDGKVAVITGASTGMALAGAQLFVDEGAYVFITGRRQEALDEAVKLIGRNVTAVQGDAANLDDLDRLFDTVKREKGAIDVLWASAGTGEPRRHHEITEEHFDAAFGLNARGTLFTVQKALPLFNDGGSIIMTGSNASQRGFPGWSVYAASKAVQQGYARVWAAELKDRGIRVNVLTPGQVATAKQEELFDEETKRQFESLIPRGKMGRPEEIATVALFLASDDSSYVNGIELVADGGATAI
jgi:NAD(P)-dependent dehydrogenase (short-subunit alcohol dehydrogenase family)